MPSIAEMKQAEYLFDLLTIKKLNRDNDVPGLEQAIGRIVAGMTQKEVEWIQKTVDESIKHTP